MVRLQQIKALSAHRVIDPLNVFDAFQPLPDHRSTDRFAGAVGHRAVPAGQADERRGLAFAPTDRVSCTHSHDKCVLTAVADVVDLGHGQIEEVDGIDFHGAWPIGKRGRDSFSDMMNSKKAGGRTEKESRPLFPGSRKAIQNVIVRPPSTVKTWPVM